MKTRKWLAALMAAVMLLSTVAAYADSITTPSDLPEHDHYAWCDEPTVCATYGEPYEGDDIRHTGGDAPGGDPIDENYHWNLCAGCRQPKNKEKHIGWCTNRTLCGACGMTLSSPAADVLHYTGEEYLYESDSNYHYVICRDCGDRLWGEVHYTNSGDPEGVCSECGATFDESAHDHHYVCEDNGDGTHSIICEVCGDIMATEEHHTLCTDPDTGVCDGCGAPYTGSNRAHVLGDGQGMKLEYDETKHWWRCPTCNETAWPYEHFTGEGDPEGICSVCGQPVKPEATATPVPTAAPTAAPTAEPTAAPTAKPATNNNAAAAPTATPKPEMDGESFLSRFQGESNLAAEGDLLSGEVTEIVTLVIENEDAEDGFEGGELTIYPANSRADGVLISLTSSYEAAMIHDFAQWQESITETEELQATAAYTEFVELARAMIQSLLPLKTTAEVDAYIVEMLRSGFDGTLEGGDLANAYFDEDVDGDIVGFLTVDGYNIYLVLRGDSVELLVREA